MRSCFYPKKQFPYLAVLIYFDLLGNEVVEKVASQMCFKLFLKIIIILEIYTFDLPYMQLHSNCGNQTVST